jgi:hypothetical protein
MELKTRRIILTVLMLIFAATSISFMNTTAHNYGEFLKATQQMKGKLIALDVQGNAVILTLQFNNDSSWDIDLIKVQFNLYGNGTYVGNFDTWDVVPLNSGLTEVVVRAEVDPYYVKKLTGRDDITIQYYLLDSSESIEWFMNGAAVIELPLEDETRNIEVRERWVSE